MYNVALLMDSLNLFSPQVFNVTGHLLHWGMATVIYPLCSTNVYVISPTVPNPTSRQVSHMQPQNVWTFGPPSPCHCQSQATYQSVLWFAFGVTPSLRPSYVTDLLSG